MREDESGFRDDELIATVELKARALALARSGAATIDAREPHLAFSAAGGWFAVPLPDVLEVLRGARVAPIPHAPSAVRGVVNRRGDIVPVVDLAVLLDLPATTGSDAIVIVGHAPMLAGLLVDGWPEILPIRAVDVVPLPHQSLFVRGVFRDGHRQIKMLMIEPLVKPENFRLAPAPDVTGRPRGEDIRRPTA